MPSKKLFKNLYIYCSFTDIDKIEPKNKDKIWINVNHQPVVPFDLTKYCHCAEIVIEPDISVFNDVCEAIKNSNNLPILVAVRFSPNLKAIEVANNLHSIGIPLMLLPPTCSSNMADYEITLKELTLWWLFQDVSISVYPVASIFGISLSRVLDKENIDALQCKVEREVFGDEFLSTIKPSLIEFTSNVISDKIETLRQGVGNLSLCHQEMRI